MAVCHFVVKSFAFYVLTVRRHGWGVVIMESFIPVVCFLAVVCQPEAEKTYIVSAID